MAKPSIFISYSHQDEKWLKLIVKHLGALEKERRLTVWNDDRITAGSDWYQEIEQALYEASAAVLLISVDFLTSDFILGEEVPRILRRRSQEGLKLIPIILRSCPWKRVKWLQGMLVRPHDGKPLASFRGGEPREAEVVKIIDELLKLLSEDPSPQDFLAAYRSAFSPLYSRWDLANAGVTQRGGGGKPTSADLDDMYVGLRLGEGVSYSFPEKVFGKGHFGANRPSISRIMAILIIASLVSVKAS
jgi:hypothetical protein